MGQKVLPRGILGRVSLILSLASFFQVLRCASRKATRTTLGDPGCPRPRRSRAQLRTRNPPSSPRAFARLSHRAGPSPEWPRPARVPGGSGRGPDCRSPSGRDRGYGGGPAHRRRPRGRGSPRGSRRKSKSADRRGRQGPSVRLAIHRTGPCFRARNFGMTGPSCGFVPARGRSYVRRGGVGSTWFSTRRLFRPARRALSYVTVRGPGTAQCPGEAADTPRSSRKAGGSAWTDWASIMEGWTIVTGFRIGSAIWTACSSTMVR